MKESTPSLAKEVALMYPVRKLDNWWKYLGSQLNYVESYTVGDIRGDGDFNVVDDFYRFQRQYYNQPVSPSTLVTNKELEDVIARCRVLRFLPFRLARSMVLGMAEAMTIVFDKVKPTVIISFPIDRYITDVMKLLGSKRGIPHQEFTFGPFPKSFMVLHRGKLQVTNKEVDPVEVKKNIEEITNKYYEPAYMQSRLKITKWNFWKTYWYFKVRGFAFKAISILRRDPLNLHYLDSQDFLGHKPRMSDVRVLDMVDQDWQQKLEAAPKDRKVFIGLAVFPEAAIDYWVDDLKIIEYENLIFNIASEFSANGFTVFFKDHPLQFGFRQADLIERLATVPNTVFVPYEVSGKQVIAETDVTVTLTGTIGLEAALIGKKVVAVENFYYTPEDVILIESYKAEGLAQRVIDYTIPGSLEERQQRVISRLMRGCFKGDYYSYVNYKPGKDCEDTKYLCREARAYLDLQMSESRDKK